MVPQRYAALMGVCCLLLGASLGSCGQSRPVLSVKVEFANGLPAEEQKLIKESLIRLLEMVTDTRIVQGSRSGVVQSRIIWKQESDYCYIRIVTPKYRPLSIKFKRQDSDVLCFERMRAFLLQVRDEIFQSDS